jgi:CheY-like chemotaxis protein
MSTATKNKPAGPAQILLIDDNKMGLSARKIVLEELGYSISPHSCAHEALETFAARHFDLIITDYKMPKMTGVELIAQARKHKPDVLVILISGFADTLGLDEKTTGANAVIQKSNHEIPNLIRSVHRLLNRKASRKPASGHVTPSKVKRKNG